MNRICLLLAASCVAAVALIPSGSTPSEADAAQPKKADDAKGQPKAGEVRKFEIADKVFMEFCYIPAGEAQLGSPKAEQDYITKTFNQGKRQGFLDGETETYRGKFTTKGFWLGKYPVTQEEWKAVIGKNPSYFSKEGGGKGKLERDKITDTSRFPVEQVSWDDCQEFLKELNKRGGVAMVFGKEGKFALPHEDEWEYACRGGKGNKQPFYWGDELNGTQANCWGDFLPYGTDKKGPYLARTCAVDGKESEKYEKHPWGLMHMIGNVKQWCENLREETNGRVLRGGCWEYDAHLCRVAYRSWSRPVNRDYVSGFRICLSLEK